ncbi:MAG: SH3 domain-containing protein, partial [Treponema sp.]|nr:SH3 domain-containing protein [Treponema sp.]
QQEQARLEQERVLTHILTVNTKLYAAQDTGSAVIANLASGTGVQLKAYGDYTDLDGETAKWVQVSTASGQTGWVFAGHLRKK